MHATATSYRPQETTPLATSPLEGEDPRITTMPHAHRAGLWAAITISAAAHTAAAQGVVWSTDVSTPGLGPAATVETFHVSSVSGTPTLYAGGDFAAPGGILNIAAWNGLEWSPVGPPAFDGEIRAIDTIDLGDGPRLYASGFFWNDPPGVPTLSRLVGGVWSPIPAGPNAPNTWVGFIRQVPSPTGPTLWASSGFTDYVAAWNGSSWSVPGGGLTSVIHDALTFDDGAGEKLYITGTFVDFEAPLRMLATWDGTSFADGGGGLNGTGDALAVFDDGRGPALYVAGSFNRVGAFPNVVHAGNIARWDGSTWEPLGTGTNRSVHAISVFDDGSGPKLYAAGDFTTAGGQPANGIARWDGNSWSPVGAGLTFTLNEGGRALRTFDPDGDGPAPPRLYIGGHFNSAGGNPAVGIAALAPCPAEIDGDAALGVPDIFAFLSLWFASDPRADFDGVPGIAVPDIFAFLSAWFAGCG